MRSSAYSICASRAPDRVTPGGGESGFAAIDALMALLILSATLALALNGLQTASRLGRIAQERTQVTALARQILLRSGDGVSVYAGQAGALRWNLGLDRIDGVQFASACVRTLTVRSTSSARTYRFATLVSCG